MKTLHKVKRIIKRHPHKTLKKSDVYVASYKLEIRDTKKYGRGVFARKEIAKGETIHIFTGRVVSEYECDHILVPSGQIRNDDPLQIETDKYLILDPLAYIFNHNCNPNAGMKDRSTLFAVRNIKVGEEITYDYSTTVGLNNPPAIWTMDCVCGAKNCRKKIAYIASLPKKTLAKYQKLGALQDYIKQELKEKDKKKWRKALVKK